MDRFPLTPGSTHVLDGDRPNLWNSAWPVKTSSRHSTPSFTPRTKSTTRWCRGAFSERSLGTSKELAQNGVRRETVPDPFGGARRTLCAFEGPAGPLVRGSVNSSVYSGRPAHNHGQRNQAGDYDRHETDH